ncbi:hypothetical protein GCM10020254_66210 [Streptomyces goshikiensis]
MQPNTLLDALLAEAGMSHAGLAAHVNQAGRTRGLALRYEHTAVSRWLKGQRPRGQVPDLICEVLGGRLGRSVGLEDAGLGLPGPPSPHATPLSGFVDRAAALWRADEQGRIRLLTAEAVTGTPAVIPVWEWENPPEDIDVSREGATRVGPEHIEILRAARAHYELMYRRAGGVATRDRIVRFLGSETAPCCAAATPTPSAAACTAPPVPWWRWRASARTTRTPTGWRSATSTRPCGSPRPAGTGDWGRTSSRCSSTSRCTCGSTARASPSPRPPCAPRAATPPPALAADLYAMQAKAYAQLGDTRAALECIRQAEAAAERIRPGTEPDETGYVQPGLVNVQVAQALLSLGDLAAAHEQAAAAVDTPAHDRGRVHRLAMLCEVQLRQGEADRAVVAAAEMAERAKGMESLRLRERLREVREQLLTSGCSGAEETAQLIDGALRVPL